MKRLWIRFLAKPPWLAAVLAIALPMAAPSFARADDAWSTPPARPNGPIHLKIVMFEDEDEDPFAAGKAAAERLREEMGRVPLKAVVLCECFEDRPYKERLLQGVCSVLDETVVLGAATYGSFTQGGCTDFDSVCLLGIGGEGISAAAGLVTEMGTSKLTLEEHQTEIEKRLKAAGATLAGKLAGATLAGKLRRTDQDRLLILLADAHSPKNQYLVEGVQQVVGKQFPITGGSANKNAGQTFVYFGGKMYQDAAVGLMLSGEFRVALAGRQAKQNEAVIRTAREAAAEAMGRMQGRPLAALAFDCAGRRGKLKRTEDELAAMQEALGTRLPLFGCYCAGEVGPLGASERRPDALCGGSGWHVMFTIIGLRPQ